MTKICGDFRQQVLAVDGRDIIKFRMTRFVTFHLISKGRVKGSIATRTRASPSA
jgi:hypothetical protein